MNDPNQELPPAGNHKSAGTFENLGRKLDERPEVQAAEKALRAAQEQLERARDHYQEMRSQAAESLEEVRHRNVGDLLSATLELVRKISRARGSRSARLRMVRGAYFPTLTSNTILRSRIRALRHAAASPG